MRAAAGGPTAGPGVVSAIVPASEPHRCRYHACDDRTRRGARRDPAGLSLRRVRGRSRTAFDGARPSAPLLRRAAPGPPRPGPPGALLPDARLPELPDLPGLGPPGGGQGVGPGRREGSAGRPAAGRSGRLGGPAADLLDIPVRTAGGPRGRGPAGRLRRRRAGVRRGAPCGRARGRGRRPRGTGRARGWRRSCSRRGISAPPRPTRHPTRRPSWPAARAGPGRAPRLPAPGARHHASPCRRATAPTRRGSGRAATSCTPLSGRAAGSRPSLPSPWR